MNRHPHRRHTRVAILLTSVLFCGGLLPAASAQKRDRRPVVVSFGQPNIWSLEQLQNLLSRVHPEDPEPKYADATRDQLDPNAEHAARIDTLRSLMQPPSASGTPSGRMGLPTNVLDGTQLEIIARQLTLLRDEVAPGERLVFLELTQSINATPGGGDGKLVQARWHVKGYSSAEMGERRLPDIGRGTVRTVDIYPRRSSPKVKDTLETARATGILAAFKFLLGFAGQVYNTRQGEEYERSFRQELYAAGLGKGNDGFGWTFGARPGTKRVAQGVRTTYAALVVPDDAGSIVLSARGCYFPRKSYKSLEHEDGAGAGRGDREKRRRYRCGEEQTYVLPVPGGGSNK